ncbi:MucR family transcriptional regulator [Xanthobacter autotrophicus]|uniref:MucR family transcriptional regulator n=1 Tax=Xanthobacter TaxID=279 RepID=UPI0024AC643B|nr:MucR family transcriptional regulator [Xanthobacter autotrophicus]MDI4665040.1 MucR family transcriptional regulator [Xanthobacter autotrophicus]
MTEPPVERKDDTNLELVADIVAAFVGNNTVLAADLPALIRSVYSALEKLGVPEPVVVEKLNPAVAVKRSVTDDFIICLEDGKKFKSLKRHLRTVYDLTPEAYREKWGLPRDYPMVAPAYAAARSALARNMGLGQARKKVVEPPPPTKKAPSRRKAAAS